MKSLVAFYSSPRRNGITRQLFDEAVRGAREQGMKVSLYDLNAPGIRGCQACGYCRSHEGCALKDPLSLMYGELAHADAILLAAPIYFHQLSGQTKIWLDRLYPMFDTPSYQSRYPGKKAGTIFSQGFEDPERYRAVIEGLHGLFERWQWRVTGSLLSVGGTTYGGETGPDEQLLAQARLLGRTLAE